MQRILGLMRKAITEYNLIQDGDRIAVGVSGGKDSVVLLLALQKLRRFIGIDYTIVGITLDPCFNGNEQDYSPIQKLCDENDIEYVVKRTQIGEIVFDIRKEANPCSLCAKMRRGALHDVALDYGCNKIALGHHFNDAVETFIMNLFQEGRIGCFSPISYLSRKNLHLIRPLVLTDEQTIISTAKRLNLPIVKSICPADGVTERQRTKEFIREREKNDKYFSQKLFGAMKRANVAGFGDGNGEY